MKCRTTLQLLLAAMTLLGMPAMAAAATPPAATADTATAANVTVTYDQPEKFTETRKLRSLAPTRLDDGYLKTLKTYIETRAGKMLPPGERLDIVVTDIDRAGSFEPWRRGTMQEVRIIKDIYPPRIDLHFRLLDASGKVIREIVATTGTKGSSIAEDRLGGLQEFASKHPDFKVLQVQYGVELREDGIKATENYLSAYPGPGFDGIWNYDDGAAIGAAAALKQANLTGKVHVTGFDAEADGAQAIKAGDILADSGGQFVDGGFTYIMAYDYLNGHEPKNPYVVMDYLLVTKDNVDKYIEQFGSGMPPYDVKKMSVTYNPNASTDDFKIAIQ